MVIGGYDRRLEFEVRIDAEDVSGTAYAVAYSRISSDLRGYVEDGKKLNFDINDLEMTVEATYDEHRNRFVGKIEDYAGQIECDIELTKN